MHKYKGYQWRNISPWFIIPSIMVISLSQLVYQQNIGLIYLPAVD